MNIKNTVSKIVLATAVLFAAAGFTAIETPISRGEALVRVSADSLPELYLATAKANKIKLGKQAYKKTCTICHGNTTSSLVGTAYTPEQISQSFIDVSEMQLLTPPNAKTIKNISLYLSK